MREYGQRQSFGMLWRGWGFFDFFCIERIRGYNAALGWNNRSKERRMRRVKLPVVISLLATASMLLISAPGVAQQKSELPHPKTLPELQQAIKGALDKEHVPGAGVALVGNGEVLWCGGIGEADIAAKRAVSCDTEFRVGSISKIFVALALLKLQEEGRINLYARLQDVAPEIPFKNRWEATHPVRV